jgi:hypothetical protein
VCGLASEGQACPAGPTESGHCPALAECAPLRDGDRWRCNRSALRGGECEDGPTPEGACRRVHRCRPVRSLRAIRGRFVAGCTLVAVGVLMILLNANWRDRAISPGALASQHAQILEGNSPESNCAACHAAAERSAAGWTTSLVGLHGGKPGQSQRCMACHEKTIAKEHMRAAHNVPQDELRKITSATSELSGGEVACAACHREHQGAQFELTAMDNAACQACHQQRYESFATDHPDFGAWPYERRTRIVFNHASHRAKHFTDAQQAFDCRKCHVEDASGDVQLLASYEAACAPCHDEKIAISVSKGVPMLALPTLDTGALKDAGHDIGAWPKAATGDFDGRLPPMMKLLLAGDPGAAKAMQILGADFDFFDVDPDDPKQLEACAILAAAIKRLLHDICDAGPATVTTRLQASTGRHIPQSEIAMLLTGLSTETIRGAVRSWFPDATSDLREWANMSGEAVVSNRGRERIAFDQAGTWLRDDATMSIRYRPAAHADPILGSWLKLLAAMPDLARQPVALAMFKELSNPTTPGLCASCHSVEQAADGRLTINWRASDRTTDGRRLTKFSHGAHLMLPQLADCAHCHTIDNTRSVDDAYVGWNPQQFSSEFAPLTKRQCADCHTAKAAGDRCQQCHNYHVDGIENWRVKGASESAAR